MSVDAGFALSAAINAAPSLRDQPSLAAAVSQDPQVPQAAQTVAAATEYNAAQKAIEKVKKHSGFLGSIAHAVGEGISVVGDLPGVKQAASTVADWMNKGTENAQHEYRYVHDLFAHHGVAAGLGELALMSVGGIVGGVGGLYSGGPVGLAAGIVAGSESAGALSQFIPGFSDSWARTAHGEKYQDGGVSFGRDVTSLIPGLSDKTTQRHSIASGLLDAVFDIGTDPLLAAGKLNSARKVVELGGSADEVSALRVKLASTITLNDSRAFDLALQNPRVKRAVERIAETRSASDMRAMLPRASDEEIRQLLQAKDINGVRQVYSDNLAATNMLNKAPVLSLLSPVSSRLRDIGVKSVEDSTDIGKGIAGGAVTLSQDTTRRELMQRRFLTKLPLDTDPGNKMPTKSFHLNDNSAGDVIHSIVKYSYNQRVANAVRDAFVDTTDLTTKATIYKNAVLAAGWNMGLKDADPAMWKHWSNDVEHNVVRNRGYGITPEGAVDEARIATDSGSTAAAVWTSQAGRAGIPHFNDMRLAVADAGAFKAADSKFGKVLAVLNPTVNSGAAFKADTFLYNTLTQNVFKRLALFSGGFALRIGLGEGLYQSLDDGAVPFLRSQLATTSAKMKFRISADEKPHYIAAALAAGMHRMSPREAGVGMRLLHDHEGHILPHELDAGHVAHDSLESKVDSYTHSYKKIDAQTAPAGLSSVSRTVSDGDQYYDFFLRKHLDDIASSPEGRVLAESYLRHLDHPPVGVSAEQAAVDEHAKFLQSAVGKKITRNMDRASVQALANNGGYRGYASQQLKNLIAATSGRNAVMNRDLLENIKDGVAPSLKSLGELSMDHKPLNVPGFESAANHDSSLDRLFNAGHHKIISPIINGLSRNGAFIRNVAKEEDIALKAGLSPDDAWRIAQQRAAFKLMPDIHNPNIRTQFSELARNLMPFYFAQDQAYRRWGRLVQRNPEALRKIQLIHQAGTHTGFIHTDPQSGQETFMYPMSGYVGVGVEKMLGAFGIKTLGGVPLSFSGNVSSLSSVTPFTEIPGLHLGGPVVGIPLQALETFAPETSPINQSVKGPKGSGTSIADMIFPSAFLKNMATGLGATHSRSFQSAQMQAMQVIMYKHLNGKTPDEASAFLADPHSKQLLIDESKNYARTMYMMKALIGEGLPTQPTMHIGGLGLKDEFRALVAKGPTIGDAITAFQAKHPGQDLTPFSVFQSKALTGGYVPPTQEALDYYELNRELLTKLPYGGAWLLPQTGTKGDATKIYNEQVAIGLRHKLSPDEFADRLYVAAGNAQYYGMRDMRDEALKQANGDVAAKAAIDSQWTQVSEQLKQHNPVWASQQGNQVAAESRARTLQEFDVLFDPKNQAGVPDTEQFRLVRDLYGVFKQYDTQRLLAKSTPGKESSAAVKQLDGQWEQYLTAAAAGEPRLAPVIQSVFSLVK